MPAVLKAMRSMAVRSTKILAANLLLFLSLLMLSEVMMRSASVVSSCLVGDCDWSTLASVRQRSLPAFQPNLLGLSRYDPYLGYVPNEGFARVINDATEGWKDALVTIRGDGFRSNNAGRAPLPSEVLVVGDSFTFGDQVSDHETWPSCLEGKLNRGVDNGGVFGYGAAQALRRALMELQKRQYTHLVMSVLTGVDFERDRLSYFSGHPRPAVVHTHGGLAWAPVPDPSAAGSEFQETRFKAVVSYLYERSEVVAAIADRFFPHEVMWYWLTTEAPDAAPVNEIIEWTLTRFSQLKVEKTLLLQYFDDDLSPKVSEERAAILKTASDLSLSVVDTLPMLKQFEGQKLWQGHHTSLGNELVCEYLFEQAFQGD